MVEPLGHLAAAYEAAIALLERKFGGERRKLALHLKVLVDVVGIGVAYFWILQQPLLSV